MRKKFNVTGSCNPERHYMVDTAERFAAVEKLIDAGEYFTINRARQYGKTTMLQTIRRRLSDKYLVIKTYIRNKDGRVMIHNLIFEEALFLYFTLDYTIKNSAKLSPFQLNYVRNGQLNMEHVVTRFADLMHQEYRKSDEAFLERQGRLVFLSFLKPIINGIGFYYAEPQTRDNRRMDLVVTYDKQEFVIELKIWHGDKYEELGRDQLSDYLTIRGMNEGYLVTFDFSKNKQDVEPQWIEWNGKRIFEVIV